MNVLEHYCSINVRENRKTNQEWTIQKHRHQWGQATEGRQTKQKNKQQKKQTKKNKKQTNKANKQSKQTNKQTKTKNNQEK